MTAIPIDVEPTSAVSRLVSWMSLSGPVEVISDPPIPADWLKDLAPEAASWITRFTSEMLRFSQLAKDWNSYGAEAPNPLAMSSGIAFLEQLWDVGVKPTSIGPLADGGVFISLQTIRGRFDADFYNSGETFVKIQPVGGPTQTWESYGLGERTRSDFAAALREMGIGQTPADASAWEDSRSSV